MEAPPCSRQMSPLHVVVMQHGIDGHDSDFDALRNELNSNPDAFRVWDTKCNHGRTHEGIARCSERLWQELEGFLASLEGRKLRVSLVGHSFGGLLLRHCAVRLHALQQQKKADIELACFVSLATPHLGSRNLGLINRAGARPLFGRSGAELLLDAHATFSLDADLCDEAHCAALHAFGRRITYASLEGDWVVSFASGSLLDAEEQEVRAAPPRLPHRAFPAGSHTPDILPPTASPNMMSHNKLMMTSLGTRRWCRSRPRPHPTTVPSVAPPAGCTAAAPPGTCTCRASLPCISCMIPQWRGSSRCDPRGGRRARTSMPAASSRRASCGRCRRDGTRCAAALESTGSVLERAYWRWVVCSG